MGNAFEIDPELGILRVARDGRLDISVRPEYMLVLGATDNGMETRRTASVPVHVLLTMADSDPPRFEHAQYATEVYEDLPVGHAIVQVAARSQSALLYELVGVSNKDGMFRINPSSGIITARRPLDFETRRRHNLTVQASTMFGVKERVAVTAEFTTFVTLTVTELAPCGRSEVGVNGELQLAYEPLFTRHWVVTA